MELSRRAIAVAVALSVGATAMPARSVAQPAPALAIDEGMFVDVNGVPQWITIRGRNLKNPVLLWLHGGPGMHMSFMAPVFTEWERDFTIVQWDQPGSGATALKNRGLPSGAMTVERYTRDGIAVTEFIRTRLKVSKVVLMGISWGTLLGVEMVQKRPELFSAYVGTAQAVGDKGNKLGYELALKTARERGDATAVTALEKVGPPPYKTLEELIVRAQYTNPPGQPPSPAEVAASAQLGKLLSAPPPKDARYNAPLPAPPDSEGGMAGFGMANFMATQRAVFAETWRWEARHLGLTFKVPVFIFQGENDINTPTATAREYFDEIQAPKKAFAIVPGSSHSTIVFHDELLRLLRLHVLPVVRGGD
jgi:pimeloyl-ACP methyl ester carboxylesterase